jgi:hypothetical protein
VWFAPEGTSPGEPNLRLRSRTGKDGAYSWCSQNPVGIIQSPLPLTAEGDALEGLAIHPQFYVQVKAKQNPGATCFSGEMM